MTLESINAGTATVFGPITIEETKLFQEVLKLVQTMPRGVPGLVKQFEDKGLGYVASRLTAKGPTQTISPEQLVQGLGVMRIDGLASASGLDARIVRRELVTILPKVVRQLTPPGNVVAPAGITA
jgi:uncharacterized protein YidB (DUF937 family)